MRKYSLGFILILTTHFSFGQQKIRKNELSISYFKVSTFDYYDVFVQRLPFKGFAGINVSLKKQVKPTLFLRTSLSFYKQNFNSPDLKAQSTCFDCNPTKIKVNEGYFNFGVERRKIKSQSKKIGFYSGIDFTLFYLHTRGKMDGWSAYKNVEQTIKGLGIQPFVGFRTSLFNRVTLSMESSMLIGGAYSKYFSKGLVTPFKEYTSKKNLMYGQLNFLRLLSFNYDF